MKFKLESAGRGSVLSKSLRLRISPEVQRSLTNQAPCSNTPVMTKKKPLVIHPNPCYPGFAFVALVSPLGKKAVARSHLRPFFCAVDRFAASRAKLEDGRGSLEGLGTRGIR